LSQGTPHRAVGLRAEAQHYDPGVLTRRVLLDIGEADIQRNQSAAFEQLSTSRT